MPLLAGGLGSGLIGKALELASGALVFTVQTDNPGATASNQFRLSCRPTEPVDFVVAWGDGSTDAITAHDEVALTHTFDVAGPQTISITGSDFNFYFDNAGDKLKLISIDSWGDVVLNSALNGFYGCSNLLSVPSGPSPFLATIRTMASLFRDCRAFNADLSSWDVSGIETMFSMFLNCNVFNADLSSWDVSNVSGMLSMFRNCTVFASDLSYWTVSALTNATNMFLNCKAFNANLSSWDVSGATNLTQMLKGADLGSAIYSAMLISWANLPLQPTVTFHGGDSKYTTDGTGNRQTDAAAARAYLETNFGWTITDGGPA